MIRSKQRRFAVVHVAEERNDRRTRRSFAGSSAASSDCITCCSRLTAWWKVTWTPNSTASSSAISVSSVAAMLLIVPNSSSLARMSRAGTPRASEKLRTVQGNSTKTFSRRGAAVLAPVRRMCVLSASKRRWLPLRRLPAFAIGRRPPFAFQLSLFAAAERHGALLLRPAAGRPPRRGRSRPEPATRGAGSSLLPAAALAGRGLCSFGRTVSVRACEYARKAASCPPCRRGWRREEA